MNTSVTAIVPYTTFRLPSWRYEEVCEAQTTLIAAHLVAEINERFANRPGSYDTQVQVQHLVRAILASYPDRHFDYVVHYNPQTGKMRFRRCHVKVLCPFHGDEWDEVAQAYKPRWDEEEDEPPDA